MEPLFTLLILCSYSIHVHGETDVVVVDASDCTQGNIIQYSYQENMDKMTIVVGAPGMTFHVYDNGFDLQDGYPCKDFVRIYDGDMRDSILPTLISETCDSDSPIRFTTSGNTFSVWFTSDDSINGGGFQLSYGPLCRGCDAYYLAENCYDLQGTYNCLRASDCALLYGPSVVYRVFRCINGVTKRCTAPCTNCPTTVPQLCKDVVSPSRNCIPLHHTLCSKTIGLGMTSMVYKCPSGSTYVYIQCDQPCCCTAKTATGLVPIMSCSSPGVITEGSRLCPQISD